MMHLVEVCVCTCISTTATTENVRIIVLPAHSCSGTLQNLYLKLLHSSTQTPAGSLNGERQVSCMTDEKVRMSKVRSMPESLVADCSMPALHNNL